MAVSKINQDIPQYVMDAAMVLHQQKNTDLICISSGFIEETVAECNSLWRYADGQIEFKNLEARNHCTALGIFRKIIPLSSADALFEAAEELWRKEIGHSDFASGRLLGFASQHINVLGEAAQAIKNKQGHASDVFNVLQLVGAALPHLVSISADDIVALIDAQHEFTKRDMARGLIFNAIEHRLRSESQIAWEVFRVARGNITESTQTLYSTALQALMHTDQKSLALENARDDADHIDQLIAGPALWTLARAIQFHELNSTDLEQCIAVLIGKTRAACTDIQQAAIRAVAHAALKDERLMSELVRLAADGGDYTLAVIADFLFLNQQNLPVSFPHFKTLLKSLVRLSPSQQNVIKNFDWFLSGIYKTPENRQLVLDFLSGWLVRQGGSGLQDENMIELFDQTIMQIVNDEPEFEKLITNWMVASERKLAVACGGLIRYLHVHGMKSPEFSSHVLSTFNPQDFKFLARRMLGYVIYEETLLSLTFSLLKTTNALERSFGLVHSLLTEELGRDYPYATMEALKLRKEAASSPEKELLAQVHAILLQRSTANDHLDRLQELRPPMRLHRAIAQSRARGMEHAQDVANEKSIFRKLVTTVPLKAGRGWFSVSDNQVGPTQHLQSISHSITLPKRALTDPVGYAIAGLHYRIAKRDDE